MTSHKDEALRLIAVAKQKLAEWVASFDRGVIELALDMAAKEIEAIEELKRPRRAKKEAADA